MTGNKDISSTFMLPVGTILHGSYRIEAYLASGGFGNTYAAVNQFGEKVAIKEFFMRGVTQREGDSTTVSITNPDNEATFQQQLEKFRKEARRLHELNNPHIVHVTDLFDENGTAYYAMNFIDGESLSQRQKRMGRPMAESMVLGYLDQILVALKAIHGKGFYHLDLKPANIMLDKDGNIFLIDFGSSKQINIEGGATTSTAVSYTAGYAPREQMEQNAAKFGPWTDFYALGATLYTLLTNHKPPMPSDIDEDDTADKHEALPGLSSISPKIRSLVLWLLNTNRNKRPKTASEISDFLSEVSKKDDSAKAQQKENTGLWQTSKTDNEETVYTGEVGSTASNMGNNAGNEKPKQGPRVTFIGEKKNGNGKSVFIAILAILVLVAIAFFAASTTKVKPSATVSSPTGYINGHGYVDLGLSVKWATCNVGASSPEGYGDYYAWGETNTKAAYYEDQYLYFSHHVDIDIRCRNIGKDISGTGYDVAKKKFGSSWRMPTETECNELKEKCKWKWCKLNGVNGYKIIGPNGNSIFLPAGGICEDDKKYGENSDGYYYSSTPMGDEETALNYAQSIYFRVNWISVGAECDLGRRPYGQNIRPVSY